MRILESEGPQKSFSRRFSGKREELSEWEKYIRFNKNKLSILENKKPDIVQVINEKLRIEKEKEKKREKEREKEVKEDGGEWCVHGESGEYYWNGESEQVGDCKFEYETCIAEEEKDIREEQFEDYIKERK